MRLAEKSAPDGKLSKHIRDSKDRNSEIIEKSAADNKISLRWKVTGDLASKSEDAQGLIV